MSDALHIWYVMPFAMPSDHAHSIQIVRTCHALAEAGARVHMLVRPNPSRRVASAAEALAAYHLPPHGRLEIRWLPGLRMLSTAWLRLATLCAPRGTVFYARHLRLAALLARAGRFPVIIELHGIERDTARAARAAHGIVVTTNPLRDRARDLCATQTPIEVIPNAADLSLFRPVTGTGGPRLVYTGTFQDYKGVDVLIGALAKLPGLRAFILGGKGADDPQRTALQAIASREGVADRVEWHSFVPQAEILGLLRPGDIAVMPTRAQQGTEVSACPIKLFEYMACGLPIVVSDLLSIRSVIRHGENGLLFREGDPDALAAAVRTLLADPARRQALAACALRDAQAQSWQARAKRILDFIERVRSADCADDADC